MSEQVSGATGRRETRVAQWAVHELSLATAAIGMSAEQAGGASIRRVRVALGRPAAEAPDARNLCCDVCARGTAAQGAQLDILQATAGGVRDVRGVTVEPDSSVGRCGYRGTLRII